MTIYNKGDLLIAEFPFAGGRLTKKRPALVLLDSGDADVVLARITTQPHQTGHDVNIVHWQSCGLRAPSFIRLHKIVTAEKAQVLRVLGSLHPVDHQNVSTVLNQVFGNW
jgi:mRNA interferase MazF